MKNAVLLLSFAIACGPRWSLEDRTSPSTLTLIQGENVQKIVDVEASHPISTVHTIAEGISVDSGRIHAAQVDPREGCSVEADFEGSEGQWNRVPKTENVSLTKGRLEISSQCSATEHAAKITVSFTNQGKLPVTFDWHVVATTSGEGGSDPPNDAFIRVRAE